MNLDSVAIAGPYQIASLTESDGLRNGPYYQGATLFYPLNSTMPFPGIALVPGFHGEEQDMHRWAALYASHGMAAIAVGTNSGWDFPEARADALLDALQTMRHENSRNNSPLFNQIDTTRFGVSGWSMGGGGAQIAAVRDNSLNPLYAIGFVVRDKMPIKTRTRTRFSRGDMVTIMVSTKFEQVLVFEGSLARNRSPIE